MYYSVGVPEMLDRCSWLDVVRPWHRVKLCSASYICNYSIFDCLTLYVVFMWLLSRVSMLCM